MSKIDSKVISYVRLAYYNRERGETLPKFSYTAFNEKANLLDLLFQYHEELGVDGYDEYNDCVLWLIKGEWYTTEQIKRMLALKVFT